MEAGLALLFGGITLVVLILIFIALREFWCWYWKINDRKKLLAEINSKLDRLIGVSGVGTQGAELELDTSVEVQKERVQRHYADNEPIGMEKIEPKALKSEKTS